MVIEEVKEGVFGMVVKEWWFEWDYKAKCFYSILKPKETKEGLQNEILFKPSSI